MAFLTVTLALSSLLSSLLAQEIITYSIEEETDIGQQVGPVFADAGLESDEQIARNGYLVFTDETSSAASLFSLSDGRVLTVGDRLDRETLCSGREDCIIDLDLQLEPQSYFQIVKVQVRILDINDNAPAFTGPVVSRSVSEAASVGFKIPLPSAIDPDSPANGIDHYWINSTNGIFELDRASNPAQFLIVTDQLDREELDSYRIQLTAIDKGNPPRSGSTILHINVVDVNDNLPKFDNDTYYVIIPEDFPLGLSVISVHATDRDVGANAEVLYGFDATTELKYGDYFSIDQNTGTIKVTKDLDFETMSAASLMVTATNSDGTSMASFTNVHVMIGDVNDNAPEIRVRGLRQGNVVYKEETSALDDFVAHVSVTDPDSGANGQFECFLSGNTFKLVKMYNTDYVIHNNIPLDREYQAEYNVVITCADKGARRQTEIQEIRIAISDVNDHAPVFSKPQYYATIVENNAIGAPVISVTAADPDAGPNGTVVYAFLDDVDDVLDINRNTGLITARTPLDRETTESITIRIVASDLGTPRALSATATLKVDVIDEDDNPPAFAQSQYTFWISEGQSIQSFAGRVKASDPDGDSYNRFGYFVDYDGGDSEAFTIDRSNGKIYTSRVLDREQHPVYVFGVRAVGEGSSPPKSDACSVRVYLTDINDNKPRITFPTPSNNTVYVPNDVDVGDVIALIDADDADDGNNAVLTYHIVSGNEGGHFSVTTDGRVTVAESLRRFDQRAFGLVLVVTDGGAPSLSADSYLNVVVNASLSRAASGLMSRHNLTIVIGIATASGLLMVVLIVAIVVLLRWPRMSSAARKYNYVARQLDHRLNVGGGGGPEKGRLSFDGRTSADVENDKGSTNGPTSHDVSVERPHSNGEVLYKERDSAVFGFNANIKDKTAAILTHSDGGSCTTGTPRWLFSTLSCDVIQSVRQKANDSECSSSSSAVETDSGRGSHEDVVLDNSPIKTQLDRSRDVNELQRPNHLPLLNPLYAESRHAVEQSPSVNWPPPAHNDYLRHPSKDDYHTQITDRTAPHYPHRGTADVYTTSSYDPGIPRDQTPGYSWQSLKVSSEVTV
ncbi:hypothetical protein LSH36_48g04019 [Paralvinella palmiformis]|uniref:Cadherin domain-containing protein n=1 Tax=Paralvinella palmiformis TaxID=53620 RepID=A0AAD9NEE8_9ANNE|nr:hypothetical protein LSH36_48g04019 [Paralvinella palmiformis]